MSTEVSVAELTSWAPGLGLRALSIPIPSWPAALVEWQNVNMAVAALSLALLAFAALALWLTRPRPVYLLDFRCYKPPESLRTPAARHHEVSSRIKTFTPESLAFQDKVVRNSGIGEDTYLPASCIEHPPRNTLEGAREEAGLALFTPMEEVLKAVGLKPRDIDILIVACGNFAPMPSLSAMVVNHFKMRSDVLTVNLGGMGCSAGGIAIALAKDMLQAHPRSTAAVLATENITSRWYQGNERSFLMPNCIFRFGGSAVVLSNKWSDRWRAKYELLHSVRTHMGADGAAYRCAYATEDSEGFPGFYLDRNLIAIAGAALKANITRLAPMVLPLTEQLRFLLNLAARKILKLKGMRPYTPNFCRAFDHVCVHTGGKGVLDGMESQLRLGEKRMAPSRQALFRYGNTSVASIWYVLSNIESLGAGVRRGQRVWQVAFGSGFKVCSLVWRSLRDVRDVHPTWAEEAAASAKAC